MAAMGGELDAYMFDFEPYRGGQNPNHYGDSQTLNYMKMGGLRDQQREADFRSKILRWLKRELYDLESVVIAIAPGHKANPNPAGFMHDIIGQLLVDPSLNVIDGRQLLIRTKTVSKQSQTPGMRSEDTHRGTIEIIDHVDNTGKVVVILDDIWTSGCTLRVCEEVMLATNPNEVKFFAIGKTVQRGAYEAPDDF